MTQSVNSVSNISLPNVPINKENVQETLAKSSQVVSDSFESNSAVKTISSTAGDGGFSQAAPLVPLLYVADKFIDRSMGGNIDTNILGKAARLGDKISDRFHLERFISDDKIARLQNKLSTNKFTKYFTDTFKANPICSLAKPELLSTKMGSQLDSQAQKILSNIVGLKYESGAALDSLSSATKSLISDSGPLTKRLTDKRFLDSISRAFDGLPQLTKGDAKTAATIKEHIKRFVANSDDISELALSDEIASFFSKFADRKYNGRDVVLSLDTNNVISSLSKKQFSTKQILDAVDDLAANGISVGSRDFSIARNKFNAAASKIGNTTLGKMFSKGVVKTKDVVTYGGGLISMFFMASSIMNAVKAAKEAPKGEKKATFAHVLSEQYLGMILFQPSVNLLYKAAGNKYRGMSEGGRKALADLVAKTNANEKLTKEGLKIAKLQRKLLLKGVDESKVAGLAGKGLKEAKVIANSLKGEGAKLNIFEKLLKGAGTLLGTGLDKMKIPKFVKLPFVGKVKIPQPTLKGFAGGLARFALIMFVIQPFIQKPLTKLSHKIFGEPKAYLAKQNESDKEDKKTTPPESTQAETQPVQPPVVNPTSGTNLINMWTNNFAQGEQPSAISSIAPNSHPQQINDAVPALNIFDKNKTERYIPSITPYVPVDNSKELDARANEILKRTDKIIAQSKRYL